MASIFKDLMVDIIVEGGQTMNPSVDDILKAVNDAHAKNVFVLPNNSNIILAANQAKELAKAQVYVIPTTNMPQGIAASLALTAMRLAKRTLTVCAAQSKAWSVQKSLTPCALQE